MSRVRMPPSMDAAGLSILKTAALFNGMPAEDVRTLIGNQNPRVYEKGVLLFRQGEPATAFFVIVSGWVKLYRITPDGLEVVLHVFTKGETFAEAAMFLGGGYPACAETVTPARLLRIEAAVFRARIQERPELALCMLASASRQLKLLIGQIEQIKVRSAPQRIAEFIIGLAPERAGGPVQIEFPFEKNLLANRLGMKPESFSRALSKLRRYGVTVEKEAVAIADLGRLREFAGYGD